MRNPLPTFRALFVRGEWQDGLDSTIDALRFVREASLDLGDRVGGEIKIELPAADLDGLLALLDQAKRYRDYLHRSRMHFRLLTVASLAASLFALLLNVFGFLLRRWYC